MAKNNVIAEFEAALKNAEQGNINAQAYVGILYYKGVGTPIDRNEGIRWLSLASSAGNKYATSFLEEIKDYKLWSDIFYEKRISAVDCPYCGTECSPGNDHHTCKSCGASGKHGNERDTFTGKLINFYLDYGPKIILALITIFLFSITENLGDTFVYPLMISISFYFIYIKPILKLIEHKIRQWFCHRFVFGKYGSPMIVTKSKILF